MAYTTDPIMGLPTTMTETPPTPLDVVATAFNPAVGTPGTRMPSVDSVPAPDVGAAPVVDPALQALATTQVPAPQPQLVDAKSTASETTRQKGMTGLVDPSTETVESAFRRAEKMTEEGLNKEAQANSDMVIAAAQEADKAAGRVAEFGGIAKKNREAQVEKETALRGEIDSNRKRAEATINPNRFWDNMSGTRTALTILLAGLSGINGKNQGVELIENAINRDVAAQKADVDNARAASESGLNAYQSLRRAGLDQVDADLTLEKYAREQADLRFQSALGKAKSEVVQGKLQQMIAENQAKMADIKFKLESSAQDKVTNSFRSQTTPTMVGGKNLDDDIKVRKYWSDEVNNDKSKAGAYRMAQDSYQSWLANRKAGADSTAVAEFVAVALKQGSFSPTFKALLKQRGYIDKAGEFIRSAVKGGEDPELMNELEKSLRNKVVQTKVNAKKAMDEMRSDGLDPNRFFGQEGESESAASVGLKPRQ